MVIRSSVITKNSAIAVALSCSVLLTLSACSGDKTADTASVEEAETTIVAVEEPVVAEPVEEAVVVEVPATPTDEAAVVEADTDGNIAEAEVLAVDAGAKLYESNCKVCHANGLLNAPKYGDAVAWATPKAKDIETLYSHSAQGFNKMPAQAVNGVSEAQVRAAVDYMLAAVS